MHTPMQMYRRASLALTTLALSLTGSAFASTSGPSMPWDSAIKNLTDNLAGPVARGMIIAAIVVAGITWAFTEHGTGGRKLSQLIFGGGIALGAVSLIASLGFTAALI